MVDVKAQGSPLMLSTLAMWKCTELILSSLMIRTKHQIWPYLWWVIITIWGFVVSSEKVLSELWVILEEVCYCSRLYFQLRIFLLCWRLFSGSLEKSKLAWGICKCLWHCFQSHLNSLGSFFAWSMFSKATIDKHDLALPLSFIIVGKLPLTPPCSKNCFYRVPQILTWKCPKSKLKESLVCEDSISLVPCLLRFLNPLNFFIFEPFLL